MSSTTKTILVVGASGATGRHVVAQLLSSNNSKEAESSSSSNPPLVVVKVIVRSADKMRQILSNLKIDVPTAEKGKDGHLCRLDIIEASLLDLSDDDLLQHTANVDVVISCLGHTLDWKGIYGHPRKLVTDATRRLTTALEQHSAKTNGSKKKFILMGSDGVAWAGHDDVRPYYERVIIAMIRYLLPPHVDNEQVAAYLLSKQQKESHSNDNNAVEWVIVRPTDLVNEAPSSSYQLYSKPQGSLFGSGTATRSHVAKAMVSLVNNETLWNQWKFQMPVLLDDPAPAASETKKAK